MKLTDLKDKHKGETIYVIGSGSSLAYIDPAFFSDKITVTVNLVGRLHGFSPDYLFSNYHKTFEDLLDIESIGVTLERDTLSHKRWTGTPPKNLVFISHAYDETYGPYFNPNLNPPAEDSLLYGSSSLHGAMHLAAYLGARFIILVGADCGTIDGEHRIPGYPMEATEEETNWIWSVYNEHHRQVKEWLKEKYGCGTYSLNPFINLNLEGHTFKGVE
jgi:hypothetical protein